MQVNQVNEYILLVFKSEDEGGLVKNTSQFRLLRFDILYESNEWLEVIVM